jgi:(1->4)-alpha-D-glucan 1-alpha-D-glucosylmutase
VDGLRIDHPDGLADPPAYLATLRGRGVERVWVEKILEPGEELPDWPVEGTVGYEFMADATGLFIDPAGEGPLTALYAGITGERRAFEELAREAKVAEARTTFQPEVERLKALVDEPDMADAVAALPVYRTYVEPDRPGIDEHDRQAVEGADLPERVKDALIDPADEDEAAFAVRFQQTTGAVMAKGVEDTALYRYTRLAALNEVGGDPGRWGRTVDEVHAANAHRAERFPRGLLATQTHDTKRSGDVRARIGALASVPELWRDRVRHWWELNAPLRRDGAPTPDEEYLIYQTLVGVWPASCERVEEYVRKALREAKRNTSWVEPDEEWEGAVLEFCRRLYDPGELHDAIVAFTDRHTPRGGRAAVGQLLLKLTTPGVPDVYQGDELWALSMVDPDNRRPVDWDRRREALAALESGAPVDRANVKMHLIRRALALRAHRPDPFVGAYRPLQADRSLCAFTRGDDEILAVAAVREDVAGATFHLPDGAAGKWRDVLAGPGPDADRTLTLDSEASFDQVRLPTWPVALLERA